MALLEIEKLSLAFGGLRAISELDLEVNDQRDRQRDRPQRRRQVDGLQRDQRHL